jgi:hypothetical protein
MAYGIDMVSGVETLKWSESGVSHRADPGDHNLHAGHGERLSGIKGVYGNLKIMKEKEHQLGLDLKSVYERIQTDREPSEGVRKAREDIERVKGELMTAAVGGSSHHKMQALETELSLAQEQLEKEEAMSLPKGWDYDPEKWGDVPPPPAGDDTPGDDTPIPDWLMWKPLKLISAGSTVRVIWKYWGQGYNKCGEINGAIKGDVRSFERGSVNKNPLQEALYYWDRKDAVASPVFDGLSDDESDDESGGSDEGGLYDTGVFHRQWRSHRKGGSLKERVSTG